MTAVLLNNVDHHDLKVVTRHGPEFGDAVNQVQVFPTEFEEVQREYPIVLRKIASGALRPVALLGLARDENLFLDDKGGWRAAYVPALIERGPFSIAAPESGDGEPMIKVDMDHPRVSRSEGIGVFLPQGGNTPYLERMTGVLRTIYVGHHLLDPLVETLDAANLLRTLNLEVRVSETEVYAVPDVTTIDRQRLAELDGPALEALHRKGFLQSAFFLAASLGNLQRLADIKGRTLAEAAS
ncbi:peptide ABC transporter permease [Altererythrobacter salegens]|uniref:Peptide ABC transporter permease n=1 Tax=Croceibacterium salegens TaxID=1737568 RepID=A0A6I4STZ8_9SPHN|nr:SapC family protein [Croceibacterium salegens]MXO58420.1 peptide ABC transporter permease [Croceibacterium salegens]